MIHLRHTYLTKQLQAVHAHARRLSGEKFSFIHEAELLYDVTPTIYSEEHFEAVQKELSALLSGMPNNPCIRLI